MDLTEQIVTQHLVAHWRHHGRPTFLFGPVLDDKASIVRYHSWGVALCLSDRPDRLRHVLDGKGDSEPEETHVFGGEALYLPGLPAAQRSDVANTDEDTATSGEPLLDTESSA